MNPLDLRKVYYHSEKLSELKNTGDAWPIHMQIGLTSFCNHRCVFCHGGHTAADLPFRPAVMDFDVLLSCLKQAKSHGLKAVTFVGNGEPLLYPRIDDLFVAIKDLGLEVGLFSNGALLNAERRKFVAEYATFIRLSVNGSNIAEHNMVHQCKDDFPVIVDNIRSLLELRKVVCRKLPTVGVQMVFYEKNYRSIYEAAKFWKELGVDYFEIKPLISTGFDLESPVRPAENKAEVRELMRQAESLQDDKFSVYAKYGMYSETLMENVPRNYESCLGSILSLDILENGDIPLCSSFEFDRNKICGNINDASFEEIWTSTRRKNILDELDVHKCPSGCKQHRLNEILWDYLYPKPENHINFI